MICTKYLKQNIDTSYNFLRSERIDRRRRAHAHALTASGAKPARVRTTAALLNSCVRALRAAGAKPIRNLKKKKKDKKWYGELPYLPYRV